MVTNVIAGSNLFTRSEMSDRFRVDLTCCGCGISNARRYPFG
jgi:hypothetical protein